MLTVHCWRGDKMARERTGHSLSYADVEKNETANIFMSRMSQD